MGACTEHKCITQTLSLGNRVCLPRRLGAAFLPLCAPVLSRRPRRKVLALQEGPAGREQSWCREVSAKSAALSRRKFITPTSHSPARCTHAQGVHGGPRCVSRDGLSPQPPGPGRSWGQQCASPSYTVVGTPPDSLLKLGRGVRSGCTAARFKIKQRPEANGTAKHPTDGVGRAKQMQAFLERIGGKWDLYFHIFLLVAYFYIINMFTSQISCHGENYFISLTFVIKYNTQ